MCGFIEEKGIGEQHQQDAEVHANRPVVCAKSLIDAALGADAVVLVNLGTCLKVGFGCLWLRHGDINVVGLSIAVTVSRLASTDAFVWIALCKR